MGVEHRVVDGEVDGEPLGSARFVRIYDETAPRVHQYLARRVGPSHAEDLTAEVFAQAWASRHRYDPGRGDPTGWVFGIVMNVLRRHHRSAERQLRAYGRVVVERSTADPAEAVALGLDARNELRATVRALRKLSKLERDMILLRAWAGLSYQQIGEALGIEVGLVKSRLNRARARVAAHAEEVPP